MTLLPKPFVFVRHGETPLNRDRLIGGRTEVPLTATGEQQARSGSCLALPLTTGKLFRWRR